MALFMIFVLIFASVPTYAKDSANHICFTGEEPLRLVWTEKETGTNLAGLDSHIGEYSMEVTTSGRDNYFATVAIHCEEDDITIRANGAVFRTENELDRLIFGCLETTCEIGDDLYDVLVGVRALEEKNRVLLSVTFRNKDEEQVAFNLGDLGLAWEDWQSFVTIPSEHGNDDIMNEAEMLIQNSDNETGNTRADSFQLLGTATEGFVSGGTTVNTLKMIANTTHNYLIISVKPSYSNAMNYYYQGDYIASVYVYSISGAMTKETNSHLYFAGVYSDGTGISDFSVNLGRTATLTAFETLANAINGFYGFLASVISAAVNEVNRARSTSGYSYAANTFSFSYTCPYYLTGGLDTTGVTRIVQLARDSTAYYNGVFSASSNVVYDVVRQNLLTEEMEYFYSYARTASLSNKTYTFR